MISNEETDLSHLSANVANSVLDCDSDFKTVDTVKGLKFIDGFSLINAFKSLNNQICGQKNPPVTNSDQKWQIWYWNRNLEPKSKQWKDSLQIKSSFTTRKEFWNSYNEVNGYEFGLLSRHFDYCVFKEGIMPMWEDSANRCGGRWMLEFPRKKDWRHISLLDEIWLKVLLLITGGNEEINDYIDEICGSVLMIRYNMNRIAVWTKNSNNTLVNLRIGELLKASTGFTGKLYYISHHSTVKKIVVKAEHKIHFKSQSYFEDQ